MSQTVACPKCGSADLIFSKKRQEHICEDCGHAFAAEEKIVTRRVFLSYGHDRFAELALRLKKDLEARGHEVWFDAERLKAGGDWEADIDTGLNRVAQAAEAGCVVLLMTPHSVRRPDGYCLNEIARALDRKLSVVPVMVAWSEPPLSLCRIQWLDMQDCVPLEQSEEKYQARLARLLDALERGRLDFEGVQSRLFQLLEPLPFEADVDPHLTRFTGRRWLLGRVDAWLADPKASRVFWITGGPGVGKTALACWLTARRREVAAFHLCRHGDNRKGDPRRCVLSIAYQLSSQLPDYQARLNALNLKKLVEEANAGTLFDNLIVQPLWDKFPHPGRTVVVLIDALDEATRDGKNELAAFLAEQFRKTPDWLRLILTSRPDPEVLQPLQNYTPYELRAGSAENEADLREYLARELARFAPGGVVTEATLDAVVARSEGSFLYVEQICEELAQGRLSLTRLDEFPKGLGAVYWRFFERQFGASESYEQRVRPALDMLAAAYEPLPMKLVAARLGWGEHDQARFRRSVGSLFPVRDGRLHFFHRSVMDWLTDLDRAGPYFVSVAEGHKSLAQFGWELFMNPDESLPDYFLNHLPQHLIATKRWKELEAVLCDLDLFDRAWTAGRRHEWMEYWQHLLDRRRPGPCYAESLQRLLEQNADPAAVARLADRVGWFLRELGFFDEALPFTEQSLQLRRTLLGDQHPDLAQSVHNLAELYRAQRRFPEALPLYRLALRIRQKALGPDHADVATSFHDLAEFYHDQRLYDEALYYYQKALAIQERVLPPDHHDIATCLNDIGSLFYEQGRVDEAEPRYRRALTIFERVHGPSHPDVAASLHNLAMVHNARGEAREAGQLYLRALTMLEQYLPPHHPKTHRIHDNVLAFLQRQKETDVSLHFWQQLLEHRERVGGPQHPEIVPLSERLAWLYLARGDHERAVAHARRAAAVREATAGPDHLATAESINTLVRCLQESGAYAEALPLCRRALRIRERGQAKPQDVATSLNNLGLLLVNLGQLPEAEQHLLRAVQTDPKTPNPHYWLAKLYQKRQGPGDVDRERAAWRRYLEMGANVPAREEEAQRRLDELGE